MVVILGTLLMMIVNTSLSGAKTYNNTTIRINWLSFDPNNILKRQEYLSIYKGLDNNIIKTKVEINENNGNYQLNAWIRLNDLTSITHIAGATWFGQMTLGGMPGNTDNSGDADNSDATIPSVKKIEKLLPNWQEFFVL